METAIDPYRFAVAAATRSYRTAVSTATDTATPSFAAVDIGTAAANRFVVVCIKAVRAGAAITFTSVTIGGIAATLAVKLEGANSVGAIYYANVPTGTTATIDVVFNNVADRTAVMVYDCKMSSGTPHATASSSADPSDLSLNVPANGIAIGMTGDNAATTVAWTGLTEDVDAQVESSVYSSASAEFVAAQTPLTVSGDIAASGAAVASVSASWGP